MKKLNPFVFIAVNGVSLDNLGYYARAITKDGKAYFLCEYAGNPYNEMSFERFKSLLTGMSLDDIYSLKSKTVNADVVINFIDEELRRRHKSLNKSKPKIAKKLKNNNEICLPNGSVLFRASEMNKGR